MVALQLYPEHFTAGSKALSPDSIGALRYITGRRKVIVFQRAVKAGLVK